MAFTPVQKLSIGSGAALGMLALVGLVAYLSITQMIRGERAVAATNTNIARFDRVLTRTIDAENAQRGFVTTGDERYLEPLDAAQSDVEYALDSLRHATEDNPDQYNNVHDLAVMISARFRDIRAVIALRRRVGVDSAAKVLLGETSVRARNGAGTIAAKAREEEFRVLGERTRAMTASGRTALKFILAGSLLSLILALVALQPLRPNVGERLTQRLSTSMMPAIPEFQLTLAEQARHAGDRLARLQQLIAALDGPLTAGGVAQALLQRGAPPLVASIGVVARSDGGRLTVLHALGDVVPQLLAPSDLTPDLSAPMLEAARTKEPVVIESPSERTARFPSLGRFSPDGSSDGAFIVAPLIANGEVYGALMLAFAGGRVFSDDERAYTATLGRIGGHALAVVARTGAGAD